MLLKSFSVFRLSGFDIRLDISWFFLAFLIFNTLTGYVLPGLYPEHDSVIYTWMAIGVIIALMLSIIAHEIGHAVVARHYHIPIDYIILYLFGGIAQMKGAMPHPKADFFLAIAGPAMSGVMAAVFYAAGHTLTALPEPITQTLLFMGKINLLLVASNMIPAYPLDGGRALRAVLWHTKKDFASATRITGHLGHLFAYALIAYGVYLLIGVSDLMSGIWYIVMGLFMQSAVNQSLRYL